MQHLEKNLHRVCFETWWSDSGYYTHKNYQSPLLSDLSKDATGRLDIANKNSEIIGQIEEVVSNNNYSMSEYKRNNQ